MSMDLDEALSAHTTREGVLTIDAAKPFRLEIVIDNQDGEEAPEVPFTLNAYLAPHGAVPEMFAIGAGGGALIGSDVPALLRELANEIEAGGVLA